jgi:hypothetical protein
MEKNSRNISHSMQFFALILNMRFILLLNCNMIVKTNNYEHIVFIVSCDFRTYTEERAFFSTINQTLNKLSA